MSYYSFVISLLQVGLPLPIDTGALLADLAWFLNAVEDDATEERTTTWRPASTSALVHGLMDATTANQRGCPCD
jgi:hypothetical protein